ncbi:winged helix-turn-helix transcriptional regulator [Cryptosporangium sp. NPDC048952]|uniref:winged helix-turn-helix transcriptional regulator n=1 Tax=Cryptosporangium sp. NPDC048952 TaxID=3363961 RepID=UPI00371A29CA
MRFVSCSDAISESVTAGSAPHVRGCERKMLTQTLRGLERDGLVARTTVGTGPSQGKYRLTPLGGDAQRCQLGGNTHHGGERRPSKVGWELLKVGIPLCVWIQ